jgi:hypothetical protein
MKGFIMPVINPKHIIIATTAVIGITVAYSKYFEWKVNRMLDKIDDDMARRQENMNDLLSKLS